LGLEQQSQSENQNGLVIQLVQYARERGILPPSVEGETEETGEQLVEAAEEREVEEAEESGQERPDAGASREKW